MVLCLAFMPSASMLSINTFQLVLQSDSNLGTQNKNTSQKKVKIQQSSSSLWVRWLAYPWNSHVQCLKIHYCDISYYTIVTKRSYYYGVSSPVCLFESHFFSSLSLSLTHYLDQNGAKVTVPWELLLNILLDISKWYLVLAAGHLTTAVALANS